MLDYPEVSLKSEYLNSVNHFTIEFGNAAYDANSMGAIVFFKLTQSIC